MIDTFLTKFLPMAFATNGLKNNIPVADPTTFSNASYEKGFPESTMKKVTEGGIPPQGKDFNGILNEISSHTVWTNAGGTYKFNGELSNAIGGYAKGAVLVADNLKFAVISLVNNNKINFNTNPSSISPTGPWRLWCDSETLDTIVPDLRRRMGIAENNITNLQGRMSSAEGKIATMEDTTLVIKVGFGWAIMQPPTQRRGGGFMICSTFFSNTEPGLFKKWVFPEGGFYAPPMVTASVNSDGSQGHTIAEMDKVWAAFDDITQTSCYLSRSNQSLGTSAIAFGIY